ncbi:MFS transporter [Pseudomonas umsongensis]|uniref:MFS transporter n=1 Tax=Pseudomonas umsongensis TaxID=198618 RepID=UPI00200A1C5D|nr:MFS transporter [Pseudomonas umsongensis]MCK8653798.1 MFS transporter [Pseudomonas umsongensis]
MKQFIGLVVLSYVVFYFPSGLLKSYLSQFLVNSGFSYSLAGWVVASTFAIKIIVNPIIIFYADRAHSKHVFKVSFSMLAVVCVFVVLFSQYRILLGVGFCILMMSRNFFQSLLESAASTIRGAEGSYGRVRFAGSLSVAVGTATLAGLSALDLAPDLIFIWVLTFSTLSFSVVIILMSKEEVHQVEFAVSSLKPSIPKRSAFFMFAATALIIGAQGTYYSIGTPWLERMGLTNSQILLAWTIGFIAEAFVFRYSNAFASRRYIIIIPIVAMCFVIRALLVWYNPGVTQAVLSFVLQGVTFSIPHVAFVMSIRRFFAERYSATAISLYLAVAHGIGIAIFSAASGIVLEKYAGLAWLLPAVSGVVGCAVWIAFYQTSGVNSSQLIYNPSHELKLH